MQDHAFWLILGDLNDAVSFVELTYCEMGLDFR